MMGAPLEMRLSMHGVERIERHPAGGEMGVLVVLHPRPAQIAGRRGAPWIAETLTEGPCTFMMRTSMDGGRTWNDLPRPWG